MLSVTEGSDNGGLESQRVTDSTRRHIRVLVVDDHPAVRQGLGQLLEDQPDIEVVAMSTTAEAAVAQAEHEGVDVAVVDYHLGGHNGLWVTRKLKQLPQPPFVVIFSAFANDHLAASCVVARVDALLNKGSLGSELCDAIRSVARGRRLLPRVPQPMEQLLGARLGDSEQPIFGMLLAGVTRPEVQQKLGMSASELEACEGAMLSKLEALPGELANPGRGGLDFERIIPQRVPPAA